MYSFNDHAMRRFHETVEGRRRSERHFVARQIRHLAETLARQPRLTRSIAVDRLLVDESLRYGSVAGEVRGLLLRAIVPLRAMRHRCSQILGIFNDRLVLDVLAIGRQSEALDDVLRGARWHVERKAVGVSRVPYRIDDERAPLPAPDRMPVQRRLERGGMFGEVEMDGAPNIRTEVSSRKVTAVAASSTCTVEGRDISAGGPKGTHAERAVARPAVASRPRAPRL